jgi:hypothetical protein
VMCIQCMADYFFNFKYVLRPHFVVLGQVDYSATTTNLEMVSLIYNTEPVVSACMLFHILIGSQHFYLFYSQAKVIRYRVQSI